MNRNIRAVVPVCFLAIIMLVTAAGASAGDGSSLVAQGDALLKSKNYTSALAAYDQAIAIDAGNFNAWNGKADALNRAGNFTGALAASDTAIALEPSRAEGWINRGYILYNLGRYDEEIKAYETAISLEPDNADAWFNKGYSLAGMKRYDEALAAFDRVKELRPDYPNLDANRRIAEQLRDVQTPVYFRYAPVIAGCILLILFSAAYLLYRKKGVPAEENADRDNRQARRRKERKSE
ncbi:MULTISPECIES: tetratricopeptide repeat protein [unclassified Methanoregula]|uniref:tetratricopeptide repeat protein n=1 Tax=unclassified Methanoregula TaxID=2649730 RepID=UPI0009C529FD|nr:MULTISPECIES: tetratricopeptide repeat protein [unclassified Methanoregula]OPX62671.1 MAG: lipoprotein NlpI [Methanoregula sp. PtaB.Bin085]OPY37246.1 MAG: lipoprotein NlpI [Methanoregula sp. PtaU1.Bin006]